MNQNNIHFCLTCSRRIRDESCRDSTNPDICSCFEDSQDLATPPATPRTNCLAVEAPDTEGKQLQTERQTAASAVRRWAKTWKSEFNMIYPACVNDMRFYEPIAIYKHYNMDKLLLESKVEARVAAAREKHINKIAFAVSRDLLTHRNKTPIFFTFIPPTAASLSREEFWNILTLEERREMFKEAYEDKVELILKKVESATRRDHYFRCTRIIRLSVQALNHMMNMTERTKHQREVDAFMTNHRKEKRDRQIARDLTAGLDISELDNNEW